MRGTGRGGIGVGDGRVSVGTKRSARKRAGESRGNAQAVAQEALAQAESLEEGHERTTD